MEVIVPPSNEIKGCPDNIITQDFKMIFTPSKRKKTRRINVLINGEFTINNVILAKEKMDSLFVNFDYVDFVLNETTQVDLTAIQLLNVTRNIFTESGKIVTLDFDLSKQDRLMMYHAGF